MRIEDRIMTLPLSELSHTWILDLDGTLLKHNGYKLDGVDSFLEGAEEFLAGIHPDDMVILLTSRPESMRQFTESFLQEHHVRFDHMICGVPYGERIVVNDEKPSGLPMAIAVSKKRDSAFLLKTRIDEYACFNNISKG